MKWHFMNTKPSQERRRCYLEAQKGSGFKPGNPHGGLAPTGRSGQPRGAPGARRAAAGPDPGQRPPTVDQMEVKTVHVSSKTRKRT